MPHTSPRTLALFLAMSLIWGVTWAAVKIGVAAVPPVFLAAVRYLIVAAVLVVWVRGIAGPFRKQPGRTLVSGLLVNGTYSLLFWGMQFVSSGVSSLVNLSLIPVGLFGLSVLVGDTAPSWRHAGAIALGIGGLAVLFSNRLATSGSEMELWGAAAIVAATFCYCLGTVLSRPLLAKHSPSQVTAAHALVGVVSLSLLSIALEPLSFATLRALIQPAPLAALLFLALLGTLAAYTIYLRLVRDWGAPRAGLYAFISPVVALAIGWYAFAEPLGWRETAGAVMMLLAAALAMRQPTSSTK